MVFFMAFAFGMLNVFNISKDQPQHKQSCGVQTSNSPQREREGEGGRDIERKREV